MARPGPDLEEELDGVLLSHLPKGGEVAKVHQLGLSDWCDTTRYDVQRPDGIIQSFFEKRAFGANGAEIIQAHWHSESSIYKFIPEFIPRPIASGTYQSDPDAHFILMEFEDMNNGDVPDAEAYMAAPAALHLRSLGRSPTGNFGFPVTARFANLKQPNDWESSWEVWWTKHMQFILEREEGIRGRHSKEETELIDDYISRVLPRYLRNVKLRSGSDSAIIFDANALWCHSEMELGIIRNPRYSLGEAFLEEYLKKVPISEPKEDFDSRNIMYMIRHQVCLASVYPDEAKLRDIFLDNMRILVSRVEEEQS